MADYLLDTNHLSPLVTLNHPLRQQVLEALQAGHTFAITVPAFVRLHQILSKVEHTGIMYFYHSLSHNSLILSSLLFSHEYPPYVSPRNQFILLLKTRIVQQ